MRDKILVITNTKEPSVAEVLRNLKSFGETSIRLNTDNFLDNVLEFTSSAQKNHWAINISGTAVDCDEIKSIWYRRPEAPKAHKKTSQNFHNFVEEETKKLLWLLWTNTSDNKILWVNNPINHKLLEFNKPYQQKIAAIVGFRTPETIITNNPKVLLKAFDKWDNHMIIKTIGSSKVKDENGAPVAVYTSKVSKKQLKRYTNEIKLAPVMVQRYIPKDIELRITIVGKDIFACAIHSQDSSITKDDWRRYDFNHVKHEPYSLPLEVRSKLLRFMKKVGLSFGAVDMILTPNGEYVFLEVNPSGQWQWIEKLTKMPISNSVARLLARKGPH